MIHKKDIIKHLEYAHAIIYKMSTKHDGVDKFEARDYEDNYYLIKAIDKWLDKSKILNEKYDDLDLEDDNKFMYTDECSYYKNWLGKCTEEYIGTVNGKKYCSEHLNLECKFCGKQSTRDCGESISFWTCENNLCDECTCKNHDC